MKKDANFIEKNREDLSASLQKTIIEILMDKLRNAAEDTNITGGCGRGYLLTLD